MKREIKNELPAQVEHGIDLTGLDEIKSWLQKLATKYSLKWLLAHADDGVIWGKIDTSGKLITSYEASEGDDEARSACPELRIKTLQQARLFSNDGELLLWRDADSASGWRARVIRNAQNRDSIEWEEYYDEPQLLWGTHGRHLRHGFTLLWDGAQGLRHAVPVQLALRQQNEIDPLQLLVRHYINKTGFACVVASRLLSLQ
jgi:CRISPR-associated protein (TIGR03984 family)